VDGIVSKGCESTLFGEIAQKSLKCFISCVPHVAKKEHAWSYQRLIISTMRSTKNPRGNAIDISDSKETDIDGSQYEYFRIKKE